MTCSTRNRTRLLGCAASTAVALALTLAPNRAEAQAIQANGMVQTGAAEIDQSVANTTTIEVGAANTVIDWQPFEDGSGNALDFLPTGTTAQFQNTAGQGQFAVLNRILPAANGNVAVINGNVISRLIDSSGIESPGGFIAFYSPTGILVGSTASFDVGQLMLTTLDVSPSDFENFANFVGGNMTLTGAAGSTARIQVAPGAQILASPENAFFAVVAADIQMRGSAQVNGSHAYIAGEVVNLSFSNGLFNIFVDVGTGASGTVLDLGGTIGGPSSNGAGDNHMIYGVARAAADPISMLFSGNLGFDEAQNASIINGEIILSGNYDVFGRFVSGDSISSGIGAVFDSFSQPGPGTGAAEISVANITASSGLLAISDQRVSVAANSGPSMVDGNLMLVATGRRGVAGGTAGLSAVGSSITVTGDLLVSAQHFGANSSSLQSLDEINAQGGVATVTANAGGEITVNGSALVTADAQSSTGGFDGAAGTAFGGEALVRALGGTLTIDGSATITATAQGPTFSNVQTGAEARGGTAELSADLGGGITIGQDVSLLADANAAQGSLFDTSTVSNAYGGRAFMRISPGGGTLTVNGAAMLSANATGGSANTAGAGSIGDAGEATVIVDASGVITIGGSLFLEAQGTGGENAGGTGGAGLGGRASAATFGGGTITIDTVTDSIAQTDARGVGGNGQTGGDGFGGIAGVIAEIGTITVAGFADVISDGTGGDATSGFGGNGGVGQGGNAFLQANGTLTQVATLTVGGGASVYAQGNGGDGGQSDGVTIPAGQGGDGYGGDFALPNQADSAFNSGAFILGGGDNGRITISGNAILVAEGYGGLGGFGGSVFDGGTGGNGFGGLAQFGQGLFEQDGSVGLGTVSFADVIALAGGFGGRGGFSGFDFPTGDGGDGTGGFAALTIRAGTVAANRVTLGALGRGGDGRIAGLGTGGAAVVQGSLGGALTLGRYSAFANGFGGSSAFAASGLGQGGEAGIELQGIDVTVSGDTAIEANGFGGSADGGTAGNGAGGTAFVGVTGSAQGSGTFLGNTAIVANGFGGLPSFDGSGGNGTGGVAFVEAQSGSTVQFNTLQVTASGRGADSEDIQTPYAGGTGTGGSAELRSFGAGSNIVFQRNFDTSIYGNEMNDGGMIAAIGIGGLTTGGSGIGGEGRGGSIVLRAALGGAIDLPTDPLNDPGSDGPIGLFARGYGGSSLVEGGRGGTGRGGEGLIEVDGGTMIMGTTLYSVFGKGGTSLNPSLNIAGGDAFGGTRRIRVLNGAEATLQLARAISGGIGGDGSGTGNGGVAFGSRHSVEVNFSTLNIIGEMAVADQTTGGAGLIGGDAFSDGEGGGLSLTLSDSTINLLPDANGTGRIVIDGTTQGGTGIITGGLARSAIVAASFNNISVNGQLIEIASVAQGGAATGPDGVGGNAISGQVGVQLTNAAIDIGSVLVASDAIGGDGGAGAGVGGDAQSGTVDVRLTGSSLTDSLDQYLGVEVRSQGSGGGGATGGNAAARQSTLTLIDTAMTGVGNLFVNASAVANRGGGGVAIAGTAGINISGTGGVTATDAIEVNAIATVIESSKAGPGTATFSIGSDSTAAVNAGGLSLNADAQSETFDFIPGQQNGYGQFVVDVLGGSVNVEFFNAFANGAGGEPRTSQIVADGGNLNVSQFMEAYSFRDLNVRTGSGNIIGNAALSENDTAISLESGYAVQITSDGSAGSGIFGRTISVDAGDRILLEGNLTARNGPISLLARGFGPVSDRFITMAPGASINAGTGTVTIRNADGPITLANISAGRIDARTLGASPGSDITVLGSGVLTASGSGRAIDLASVNGEVLNLAGDAGLILTGGGHYGIFAATPTGSLIGSPTNYARRYNVPDSEFYDELNPGGNFAAFRIAPLLTVTADDLSRFYGDTNPVLTASFAGFLPGDGVADLSGTALLMAEANATSSVDAYTISAEQGSLLSEQGYQFTFNSGELTVTPRPITLAADNLTRVYGNANPALTVTVGGAGLVNGDQLSGAVTTTAGVTTGVGNVAITQGTLAADSNYAVSFIEGQLTITPRPITIAADNASRIYGNANPALTFRFDEASLVNGDQLSGALATSAGATTGVGAAPITQGTLSAGANYAVSFTNGQLTITPRPITVTAADVTRIYGNANPALPFTVGGLGLVNGDQLTGALATNAGVTTGVGTAPITQGTLSGGSNYAVSFANGVLTIAPRPITVTADNLTRVYGNANPALTFTVGGAGLVNGDQLSGALATTAGAANAVGSAPITQGTLSASPNYAVSFANGVLTITPRPITISADDLEKLVGEPDPELTFTIGGAGLVNNDTLTGSLTRDPGEGSGVFVIRQGTLVATPNYVTTFAPGALTVDAPPPSPPETSPTPPELYNPTRFEALQAIDQSSSTLTRDEDEQRFGIDFPVKAETPLIAEDPLLDEPVTSGGDASLYGDGQPPSGTGQTPPAGGQ